ncbi:hypothetical protein OCK72_08770 [Fusobacterium simiae]|uniref:C-type lysozyme inhibitor domain-containing protein n=1 Tax=Fusobacterium simiae TaxID=855 RepID=A0ABT4DMU9_FUSSI|nr:hypothetical protein [Fusobacterium simiae]MCY7008716.1 hypothetical protein [Fusobacterium simiae]
MKKFAMLALAMSLFLVACGEKKEEEKPAEQPAAEATATTEAPATETAAEAVNYTAKTEDGKEFTVVISGDVATVTDADGKATELKRTESADGEKFADEAGNEIHIKGSEGIITLGDVKEATITVTEAAK